MRTAGFAVIAAMAAFALRAVHRQAGAAVALAAGLMLFFFAVTHLSPAVEALKSLARKAGVEDQTVTLLLKIAGIGLLVTAICQVLTRAGREDVATLATVAGVILVLLTVVNLASELLAQVQAVFHLP